MNHISLTIIYRKPVFTDLREGWKKASGDQTKTRHQFVKSLTIGLRHLTDANYSVQIRFITIVVCVIGVDRYKYNNYYRNRF